MGGADKKLSVDDLSKDQKEVYDSAYTWVSNRNGKLLTIGGFAGTGKSTLLGVLASAWKQKGKLVAYVTFTGKASSVLARKLKASGVETSTRLLPSENRRGHSSKFGEYFLGAGERDMTFCGTVHRLIYRPIINDRTEEVEGYTERVTLDREYDLIVIDECFHYAQRIRTEDGEIEIGKLVNEKSTRRVWSRSKITGELELKPIVNWLKKPAPSTLLEIDAGRTRSKRNARVIRCTPAHKIMTPAGYVRAGDLKEGDELIVKGKELNKQQLAVLVGSMLGDGTMGRHASRNSPQPALTQGEDQKEWLKFKKSIFGDMAGDLQEGKSGYGGKPVWRFAINVTDQARRVAEQMPYVGTSPGGRRRWAPTDKFLEWLTPLALTVWYLDNGSVSAAGGRSPSCSIHTERFDEADNYRLAAALKNKFGLDAIVSPDSRGNFFLRFRKKASAKLLHIVSRYTPSCMSYKVPGYACSYTPKYKPAAELTVAPITSIKTIPTKRSPFVYDIEVQDNHNYIAGNIVVSNCSMIGDDLYKKLAKFGIPILAVGDHGQLEPVMDVSTLMVNPDLKLEKIHRQALGSPIIALSRSIREDRLLNRSFADGSALQFGQKQYLGEIVRDAYSEAKKPLDVGMVCWMNRTRVDLNLLARRARGMKGVPQKGEVLVCLRNQAPIYNGMRGVVTGETRDLGGGRLSVRLRFPEEGIGSQRYNICAFQLNREKTFGGLDDVQSVMPHVKRMGEAGDFFDNGHAMTVHKSQGSSYDHCIFFADMVSMNLEDEKIRRLVYTAVTRASRKLTVVT